MNRIQQVATKAIIEKDGKVLILEEAGKKILPNGEEKSNYELPGGRVDFGEDIYTTLKRELKEEINASEVEIGDFVHSWTFTRIKDEIEYQFIIFIFACRCNFENLKLSDEHTGFRWISSDELDKYPLRSGYKEALKKYFTKHNS